jgi:hypothetical protein
MDIKIFNLDSPHIIATNIWKYHYALSQKKSFPNKPSYNIEFVDGINPNLGDFSVLHVGFSAIGKLSTDIIDRFDVVIIDNNVDHVQVHDELIYKYITECSNVYFLVGGFVTEKYTNSNKVLTYPADWIDCIQLYSDPLCFTRYSINITHDKSGIHFVGGALRSWRKYLIDRLPIGIEVHQTSDAIAGTKHIIGGTKYDKPFIDMCNDLYEVEEHTTPSNELYEHITLGLEHLPAGGARLGYYALPEYEVSKCVVFPEACFVNHHAFPTEKIWKCVASKTHWIMFSGSESYSILGKYGIRSILELTPDGMDFDSIDDHQVRFDKQLNAIQYLVDNPSIFDSDDAMCILNSNYESFYNNHNIIRQMSDSIDGIIMESLSTDK